MGAHAAQLLCLRGPQALLFGTRPEPRIKLELLCGERLDRLPIQPHQRAPLFLQQSFQGVENGLGGV